MKKVAYKLTIILLMILSRNNLLGQGKELTNEYKNSVVKKISELIKNNYVLKDERDAIAIKINNVLRNKKYSESYDFESFAQQLTIDLQEITTDHHFAVVYDPLKIVEMGIEDDVEPDNKELEKYQAKRLEKRRRNNFGFKKVEILPGNVGYLDFNFFRGDSLALEIAHAAMAFLSNSDVIIIDLRENHGGGAAMYQLLSSYFFGEKPVLLGEVYNALSDETQQSWTNPDIPGYKIPELDLYILISSETFSAAEAFAYDLQQLKRAKIIGENSGGGAHMVTRMIINDDFYIFMPFAGAINPVTKTNWEGVGVIPDIKTKSESALLVAHKIALENIIAKTKDEEYVNELKLLLNKISEE